ncbi:MAG: adenylosuccinate lyase, partial [Armatimonadota bacterium]
MSLTAVSALDGRYAGAVAPLSDWFSEHALIRERVAVELEWLAHLSLEPALGAVRPLGPDELDVLAAIARDFSVDDSAAVKGIERTTNHDVKAVEYWIKDRLEGTSLSDVREWVHFACTSEDINNLAHARMLRGGFRDVLIPAARRLVEGVADLASIHAGTPMLSRTHGQPASPTTFGKEMVVFVHRWDRVLAEMETLAFLGKINGAVGAFNAHASAFPDADWPAIARRFVEGMGLEYNPVTTQIESHDYIAEWFHAWVRFNNILLDFDRDVWGYVSLGYLRQRVVAGEVGSSTMPHKVNPIDFENSEANAGIANALLEHLASKLAISRWQRDLTDSSALRNMGTAAGHTLLSLVAAIRGLG